MCNIPPNKSIRLSNIELLRILSMLFIMISHACMGLNIDVFSKNNIENHAFMTFVISWIKSIMCGGVDIFVLISGWFGIRFTKGGLFSFLFQVCFPLLIIVIFFIGTGLESMSSKFFLATLGIYNGYWFVMAYLGLYILSPVFNAFIEKCSKRQFEILLICLYGFQCYYSWLTGYVDLFGGYSITLLCILYLTGRYVRLYSPKMLYKYSHYIFIISTFIMAVVVVISYYYWQHAARMLRYDNPLLILACVSLIVTASKYSFIDKKINWLATGSFAVYIVHFHPFVFKYYKQGVHMISENSSEWLFAASLLVFCIICYIIITLFDRVRIIIWRKLEWLC